MASQDCTWGDNKKAPAYWVWAKENFGHDGRQLAWRTCIERVGSFRERQGRCGAVENGAGVGTLCRIGRDRTRGEGPGNGPAGRIVPALGEMLKDSDLGVRQAAVRALTSICRPPVEDLFHAKPFRHKEVETAAAPFNALVKFGPPALPVLVEMLKDPQEQVRLTAAMSLAQMGPAAKTAIPAVVKAMREEKDEWYRAFLGSAIVKFGSDAVPALAGLLKSAEEQDRIAAAMALQGLGLPAAPALADALEDKVWLVQRSGIEGLGTIGPVAIPFITAKLKAKGESVRSAAAMTLAKMDPKAIPELVKLLVADNKNVRVGCSPRVG